MNWLREVSRYVDGRGAGSLVVEAEPASAAGIPRVDELGPVASASG